VSPDKRDNLFILHVGGLGDLVLASGALAALRAARPAARITLAARAAVAPLVAVSPLRDAVDAVIPLPIDPYPWVAPSSELFAALEKTFAVIGRRPAETFVSAELRPTWLTFVLGAKLKPRLAVTLRSVDYSRALVGAVCDRFALTVPAFRRYADARSRSHELARYERLAKALGAAAVKTPHWRVPPQARQALKSRGLVPHSYIACFPGGSAATPQRRWPPERFVAALVAVRDRFGGRVLIAGELSERALLDDVARRCTAAGLEPHVFAGGLGDLGPLRSLVANAWGYLGNDTGAAHLAAAHGVPGVTVYGGGTWPAYAPWASGSAGVVHPLPCSGCFWDCVFGRAVCVEQIGVEPVIETLTAVITRPTAPPFVREVTTFDSQTLALVGDASTTYRAVQIDRAARLEALLSNVRKLSHE
jgi:ADP-heptose:LPS heptosyltransferase